MFYNFNNKPPYFLSHYKKEKKTICPYMILKTKL